MARIHDDRFAGRRAVVTRASSGIGSAALDRNLSEILVSLEQTLVFLASLELLVLLREESEAADGLADEQRAPGLRRHGSLAPVRIV